MSVAHPVGMRTLRRTLLACPHVFHFAFAVVPPRETRGRTATGAQPLPIASRRRPPTSSKMTASGRGVTSPATSEPSSAGRRKRLAGQGCGFALPEMASGRSSTRAAKAAPTASLRCSIGRTLAGDVYHRAKSEGQRSRAAREPPAPGSRGWEHARPGAAPGVSGGAPRAKRARQRHGLRRARVPETPLEKAPEPDLGTALDPEGALHRRRVHAPRVGAPVDARLAARRRARPTSRSRATGSRSRSARESIIVARDARRPAARALQRLPASREPALRARPRPLADVHAAATTPGSGTSTARCAARPTPTTFPQGLPPDLRLGAAALRDVGRLRLGDDGPGRRAARGLPRRRPRAPRAVSLRGARRSSTTSRSRSTATGRPASTPSTRRTTCRARIPSCSSDSDDVNVQIDLYGRHSRFIFPVGAPSPRLGQLDAHPAPLRRHRPARRRHRSRRRSPAASTTCSPPSSAASRAARRAARHGPVGAARRAAARRLPLHDLPERHAQRARRAASGSSAIARIPTDPNRMLFDFQDYLRWPASLGPRERPAHATRRAGRHVARRRARPGPLQPAARPGRHAVAGVPRAAAERAGAAHPALPPRARGYVGTESGRAR